MLFQLQLWEHNSIIGGTAAQADRTAVAGKNDVIVNQLILQARIKQLSVILDDGLGIIDES